MHSQEGHSSARVELTVQSCARLVLVIVYAQVCFALVAYVAWGLFTGLVTDRALGISGSALLIALLLPIACSVEGHEQAPGTWGAPPESADNHLEQDS